MAIITISRQLGSGGDAVAAELAKRLNYAHVDRTRISELAEEYGLLKQDLERIDEKRPGFIDRYFNETPTIYLNLIQSVIYDAAKRDRVVIVGLGGQVLLRDLRHALHVKIVASRERRVAFLMEQQPGLTRETAEHLIATSDRDRAGYMKYLFDVDWMDPRLYDLRINTTKLSIEEAIQILMRAAQSPSLQPTPETTEILEKLALAKKVEAALIADKQINPRHISVEATPQGRVVLRGAVSTEQEKQRAEEVTTGIQGVTHVENELAVTIFPLTHLELM